MSYKAAAAGLDLGGGTAVLIGDPRQVKSTALMQSFGRLVNRMAGTYVTAADVGVDSAGIDALAEETGASIYTTGDIHSIECDILSPCALGPRSMTRPSPKSRHASSRALPTNSTATRPGGPSRRPLRSSNECSTSSRRQSSAP
jgi:glutamate dehydrogenase/leucine dehydrogenase